MFKLTNAPRPVPVLLVKREQIGRTVRLRYFVA